MDSLEKIMLIATHACIASVGIGDAAGARNYAILSAQHGRRIIDVVNKIVDFKDGKWVLHESFRFISNHPKIS
jgi:hypothetical protein